MSEEQKPVTQKHFAEVYKRLILGVTKMHLELLSLEKALKDAGVITEDQLRQAREETNRESELESAKLSAMFQSLLKGGKGPAD